ncbi:galactose-1-epimerase [Flavobacterium sp. Sd200]|uniref:aldose epimerase family protein n=1 Tax=Flavobacterium sp. Sd200 TaxID=2692211 RepID=UPI00136EE3D5|nr:aldose epimerase family protein [Flavobacterium sp. Sd200]MXN92110.1 galactose-1-epimerase [Flavobacterium sp. Sd200]
MEKSNISYFTPNCVTKLFGTLPNGKVVESYTLSNGKGMEATFINYGATITSLKIVDAKGQPVDVVLGFNDIDDYIDSFNLPSAPYFGSVIGRYAGRINNGTFSIDGEQHELNKNHGIHTLHGGNRGFGRAFWKMKQLQGGSSPSIKFSYTSPDGEENFPGELKITVTYRLTENNELLVKYKAESTKDTVLSLTQHSYFNLDGHSQTVAGQKLVVNADKVLEVNQDSIPTGKFIDVKDTEFDYNSAVDAPLSIDRSFVLENDTEPAASLYSEKTGLKMTVYTNQPSVHIYVGGNCFDSLRGKDGVSYHTTSGICFETQNYPDAPNHAHFPSAVLRKGEVYRRSTKFAFEVL